MITITYYDLGTIKDENLEFAVISSNYKGKFVFVRHKDRKTWEIPGGHREKGETIDEAARRELFEETGAKQYIIKSLCEYSVKKDSKISYGRLYCCEIHNLGELPNSEIEEVKLFEDIPGNLTYPKIQPFLHKQVTELTQLKI